jgi:glycosyltransferase involved in cell wall biosynthesis
MRILFVVHQFFPFFYTGVERATLNLAAQFRRMGHSTAVLSVSPPEPKAGTGKNDYVYEGTQVIACKPRRSVHPMQDFDPDPRAESIIDSLLEEWQPDIVHIMHPRYLPETRAVAARNGIPVFIHLHDYWFVCPRFTLMHSDGGLCIGAQDGVSCERFCGFPHQVAGARMRWARRELALADGVFFPSRFLGEIFASQQFDIRGWHLVPIGVDYANLPLRRSCCPGDGGRVLPKARFLGTLLPHKGPHILVEAVCKVPQMPWQFVIHGSEFHEIEYGKNLRAQGKTDSRIYFAESYDYSDLKDLLADTEFAMVPSLWYENFPIAAAMAIAADVPVIASNLGGMREMVEHYKAGFLFPAGDSSALAGLLGDLAGNPSRLQEVRLQMRRPPSLEEEAYQIEMVYRDFR